MSIKHTQWGETFTLTPQFGRYANGRLAIQLFDDVEPCFTVTVNMVDEPDLPETEVYVKTWAENEEIVDTLMDAGWLIDTGRAVPAGWSQARVMRLGGGLRIAHMAFMGPEYEDEGFFEHLAPNE